MPQMLTAPDRPSASRGGLRWLTGAPRRQRQAVPLANRFDEGPLIAAATDDLEVLLDRLGSAAAGISRAQAAIRRSRFGLNEIASEKPAAWSIQLLRAFHTPFTYLLLALAGVSAATADLTATAIISVMVAMSGCLRFWQEYHSGQAAEQLLSLVRTTATVRRPAADPAGFDTRETPIRDLVNGDVVQLSAGDLVPADVRLLFAKDLFVSQAALTGESLPVEKQPQAGGDASRLVAAGHAASELPAICLMGTSVVSGTATAVVLATGSRTVLGSLARQLVGTRAETAFDKGVRGVSWLLIRFMVVMVPVVFLINGLTKGNWSEAFLFGLAVAVGLTPEMLPMIVTANLARGAMLMARRKVIVKRLPAIQNLGGMDVLCTDKTGTLTQDRVVLIRCLDVDGRESPDVFEHAYLNSRFQTGLKNLLDRAVLDHAGQTRGDELAARYDKCDEIPFDFDRRRMSVILHERLRGRDLLICKGAVEEVLSSCTSVRIEGADQPLDAARHDRALALRSELNEDGLRVIAVAVKQVWSDPEHRSGVADEAGLTLLGLVAFLDPPKESAAPALAALAARGVAVKILTGDNEIVARRVCQDVGLGEPTVLLGHDVDQLADDRLAEAAAGTMLFAKLNPAQKARIIAALQQRGHTVGFLGDGINDAPALRAADCGVSVDTAADIAKESAAVILLEKNLLVLEEGVTLGRQTYGNTIKYVKMAASSNFGNVFSVLVASIWLPFLPMLAIHLLIQNLLYDISQIGIPFDRVDEDYLRKPRPWQVADLGRFMLIIGPISSIFDLTTFALLLYGFGYATPAQQGLFHAGWFIEGLLSQTLIIHLIRTTKIPFLESTAAPPLLVLTVLVMAAGLAIPFSPLGAAVGLAPLPAAYFPWLAATLLAYCCLMQVVKRWYLERFGTWL